MQATVAGQPRRVHLDKAELSAAALDACLAYMYTERLDINMEDVESVLQVHSWQLAAGYWHSLKGHLTAYPTASATM